MILSLTLMKLVEKSDLLILIKYILKF